ncbi:MAG: hypothetical protein MJE66_21660 [Proteobacteria bacterium]|nr:hypothetical protein [Pseudomonadota bacterium]
MRALPIWITALMLVAAAPLAAQASGLEDECESLNRASGTSCELKRMRGDLPGVHYWQLTTAVDLSRTSSDRVSQIETRFCEDVQQRRAVGKLIRWNHHGLRGAAMKVAWSCDPPSVASR